MRLDLGLWLAGGVLALIAGLLRLLLRTPASDDPMEPRSPVRSVGWGLWAPLVLTCLGLTALVAGVIWRITAGGSPPWPSSAWPGGNSADGVAMLAGGALAILAWLLFRDTRRARAWERGARDGGNISEEARGRAASEALALFGSCLLVLLAVGAAWGSPLPAARAGSWLFGLRVVAASLGLGAWLPALAAESRALGGSAAQALRPGKGSPVATGTGAGIEAMRAAYPLLTAAWLLGAAWNLAFMAAPWRGLAPEALLLAAWLLGGIYLIASWGAHPARLPAWALILLTACGTAAAVMEAWLTPLLLY
jgi:hypothetical protein